MLFQRLSRSNVVGISPPNFDDADDQDDLILSPEQSVHELIQGSRTKSRLSEWLNVMITKDNQGPIGASMVSQNREPINEVCNAN